MHVDVHGMERAIYIAVFKSIKDACVPTMFFDTYMYMYYRGLTCISLGKVAENMTVCLSPTGGMLPWSMTALI